MPRKQRGEQDGYDKAFPRALRKLLADSNTTKKSLADYLNKSGQAIAYYCDGTSSPDWETIVKIAKFFSVSTDYLLGRTEVKSARLEIKEMCSYTGLSEEAISNLHTESKDAEAISGLDSLLSSNFDSIHSLNWFIYRALSAYRSHPVNKCIIVPFGHNVPEDKQEEIFSYLKAWGGELLDPVSARDYYVSQAVHLFQNIIEEVGRNSSSENMHENEEVY